MDTHFVSTSLKAGMAFTSNINGHTLLTDASIADGGNNDVSNSKYHCEFPKYVNNDIVSILNKMKASFSDLTIDIEATLTEEHPKTYNLVKVVYKIKMGVEDRSKMEKAVRLSEDKYCGVMAMFRSFAKVQTSIVYL